MMIQGGLSSIISGLLTILLLVPFGSDLRAEEDLPSLAESLRRSRAAASSFEAFESDLSPQKMVKETLLDMAARQPQQLCNDLSELPIEDLVELSDLFDTDLRLRDLLTECMDEIEERLTHYFFNQEPLVASRDFTERPPTILAPTTWGPSRVHILQDERMGLSLPQDQRLPVKWVALTFDDGPHPTLTPQLLKILQEERVQVTFFWTGRNVSAQPRIVQEANAFGHLIGGHTQTHPNLASRTFQSAVNEISQGFRSIESILGWSDPLFRFPYGARTSALRSHLRTNGITDFFWDVDTRDWQIKDPQRLLNFALNETRKRRGGIVLFHDIQRQTIAMMRIYIQTLKLEGYTPVIYQSSRQN